MLNITISSYYFAAPYGPLLGGSIFSLSVLWCCLSTVFVVWKHCVYVFAVSRRLLTCPPTFCVGSCDVSYPNSLRTSHCAHYIFYLCFSSNVVSDPAFEGLFPALIYLYLLIYLEVFLALDVEEHCFHAICHYWEHTCIEDFPFKVNWNNLFLRMVPSFPVTAQAMCFLLSK